MSYHYFDDEEEAQAELEYQQAKGKQAYMWKTYDGWKVKVYD